MTDRLDTLAASFTLALHGNNRPQTTIDAYLDGIRRLSSWAREKGLDDPAQITRQHIRQWLAHELTLTAAQTVVRRYSGCRQWLRWLLAEEEIPADPTDGIPQPAVPETQIHVPSPGDLQKVLKACAGKGFPERRDTAMIRVMADAGPRASEVVGIQIDDVDLAEAVIVITGKGRRPRGIPIGRKTAVALDAYLRVRSRRKDRNHSALWLGRPFTPLTTSGVRQMLRRRSQEAGVEPLLHPHSFRHYFADAWLRGDGTEGDLMRITGWKSRQMVDRYAAALAASRAREAHKSNSPGDLL